MAKREEAVPDNKFAHLLQPIRSLASNWDVNVAEELEDYLEELESIHFEFENEGEAGGLNFAEAALVIQGSASVYGKKVEHLHNLVYAALQAIGNKRSQGRTADGGSSDEESSADTEEHFLTLDDIPQGGNDIDMQDQSSHPPPTAARPPTSLYLLGNCEGPMSLSRHQTYADSSGAVLLDPSDSLESCNTAVHFRQCNAENQEMAQASELLTDDAFYNANESCRAAEPCYDSPCSNGQADLPYQYVESDEDDIEDVYEPLQPHLPGPLPEKPFRLKIPAKKVSVKAVRNSESLPPLFHVASLNSMAFPEFEIYLKRIREVNAQQRRKGDLMAQFTPTMEEEAGNVYNDGENLALEDSGYVQMDGNYDHNDDPPQQPLSPVIGADMPQFDEGHLEAVMSFQDTAMHAWNTQYEAAVAGELEERVKRWQESIQPHLEAQDKHPSFDIQSYGEAIVDTLKAKVQPEDWTDFGAVAYQKDSWEVPRIFASMLQLVNAGTVLICKT